MPGALASVALGLVALYLGAEWLVKGASRLALAWRVAPLVVGLTVVAFGTSTPELLVSVLGAIQGKVDLALGNIIGSNIFNIAFILGLAALLRPLVVKVDLVRREVPVMALVAVVLYLLGSDGILSRLDGALLLAGLITYIWYLYALARQERPEATTEYVEFQKAQGLQGNGTGRNLLLVAGGVLTLVIGAQALLSGSITLARALGVSELVIGLTLVAAGTSLPELATSVVAALRHETDISVGNVVGSNTFNIAGILGLAALLQPIPVPDLGSSYWVMLGVSLLLWVMISTGRLLDRLEAGILLLAYVVFVWQLF
ncbi:MAG: calcium/sodium antiporter [Deinococcus sp.]|nr:calcium/sodium antiporter [Deinococcus sp.]